MEPKRTIEHVRADIDEIDAEIVRLLAQRARLALEIGKLKEFGRRPYFSPEREHQVFERLSKLDSGPLTPLQITAIFKEIVSAARAAEKPLCVSFWGPEGTFSHLAATQMFGRSTSFLPVESIEAVFKAVEYGRADYGIVPIENSVAGVIPETLDMFPVTNVKICDETFLKVEHHLASGGATLNEVDRIYAGPQPVAQCHNWIRNNLPRAEVVSAAPTARAAEMAMKDENGAAIVNTLTIENLGMSVLAERIEDSPDNKTRFVVLGFNEPKSTGRDKTTILFNLRNQPGELYKVLGAFADNYVNLLMIESRPAQRTTFEYLFFVDCGGHHSDQSVSKAIEAIKGFALEVTILGSFPSHDPSLS